MRIRWRASLTNIHEPQVPEATPAHASVHDELGVLVVLVHEARAGVGLPGRRGHAHRLRQVPAQRVRVRLELQHVQIIQVPTITIEF